MSANPIFCLRADGAGYALSTQAGAGAGNIIRRFRQDLLSRLPRQPGFSIIESRTLVQALEVKSTLFSHIFVAVLTVYGQLRTFWWWNVLLNPCNIPGSGSSHHEGSYTKFHEYLAKFVGYLPHLGIPKAAWNCGLQGSCRCPASGTGALQCQGHKSW